MPLLYENLHEYTQYLPPWRIIFLAPFLIALPAFLAPFFMALPTFLTPRASFLAPFLTDVPAFFAPFLIALPTFFVTFLMARPIFFRNRSEGTIVSTGENPVIRSCGTSCSEFSFETCTGTAEETVNNVNRRHRTTLVRSLNCMIYENE